MIKKGWGIDRNMEVHEMPDNNAFLFRFTLQSDYIKILKGRPWSILGALLNLQHWDEFTVIQEVDFGWCPFWIQFHGLPHNTLDDDNAITLGNAVGRVMMYESPQDGGLDDEDAADNRVGPGLGTSHVKTKDHSLVAHNSQWNEFPPETPQAATPTPPAAAAGIPMARRVGGDTSRKGKTIDSGDESARQLWRYPDMEAGKNQEFNGINHEFNGIKAPGNKGKTTDSGDDSARQLWRYPDMEAGTNQKFNGINHEFNGINDEFNGINHEFNGIKSPGNKGKTTDSGDDSARQLWRYPDMEAGTNQKFNGINHEFNGIKAPGNGNFLIKELVKAPIQKDLVKAPMQKERNFKIVELPADTVTANMVEELIFPTAIHQVSLSSPINSPISINQGHVIRHLPKISDPNTHQPSPNSDPGNQQPTTIPGPVTHNPPISDSAPATQHLSEPVDIPVPPSYHLEFPENDDAEPSLLPLSISGLSPLSAVTSGLNRFHMKRHHDPFEDDQVFNPTKKCLLFLEPASTTTPSIPITTPPISSGTRSANCRRTKNNIRSAKGKSRFKASKVPVIRNPSHPPPSIISPDHVNISPPPLPAPNFFISTTNEKPKMETNISPSDDGSWDVSPLRHVLDDRAVEAILTIPIPRVPTDDRQRWLLSKNGVYSVKSGYYSLTSAPTVITPTVRSTTHLSSDTWKATWKVKTTPKVVNFLWRVLSMPLHQAVPLSNVKEASPSIKLWWQELMQPQSPFSEYDKAHISWILWFIWKSRNDKDFNHIEPNPTIVIEKAAQSFLAFWSAFPPVSSEDTSPAISVANPQAPPRS
ncbi:hypothetical protein K1719_018518 [Acacia pycnantha]|nr:hypothetical protein K1719_018518 [Acacia pycnantha]